MSNEYRGSALTITCSICGNKMGDEFYHTCKALEIDKLVKLDTPSQDESEKFNENLLPDGALEGSKTSASFSRDAKVAQSFGKNVFERYLKPDAKILTDIPESVRETMKKPTINRDEFLEIKQYARENGYDAIDLSSVSDWKINNIKENEILVLNPEALKTKSQLEDIWNKANGKNVKTKISPYDELNKLIVEGKVRIKYLNGKNMYQIKKDTEWVNVKSREDAIKQILPERKNLVENQVDNIKPENTIPQEKERVNTKLSEEGLPLALNKREKAILEGKIQPGEKMPVEENVREIKEKSVEQKVKTLEEAKSNFDAYSFEPLDEVKTKISRDVLSDISSRAKIGSFQFKPIKSPFLYTRDLTRNNRISSIYTFFKYWCSTRYRLRYCLV